MSGRHLLYIILILAILQGCTPGGQQDPSKWTVTLSSSDKKPYGTYLAFKSLKFYFPDAKVVTLPSGFKYSNMSEEMKYNYSGRSLLIAEGLSFNLSDAEWTNLKQFIKNGNEVVLLGTSLDDKIEKELRFYKSAAFEESFAFYQDKSDFDNKEALTLADSPEKKYGYEGRSIRGYFSFRTASPFAKDDTDSNNTITESSTTTDDDAIVPDTLGYAYTHPNVIRYAMGEGHLTVHAAPLVLSNYFLLQKNNIDYLTGLWQTLPKNISRIYWNGYYYKTVDVSSYDILWRFAATRMALLLGILLLLIYILFEGKRKQRIIPIVAPLKNDSVSFVETVGRLYYNKGNHTNLAEKMVQQFLEWVRTHYFLNTNQLNELFIQQLVIKSGQPEATVRGLMEMVHEIKLGSVTLDDAYLYQLYSTIQVFYKNLHK